jgi:hypothetical protein
VGLLTANKKEGEEALRSLCATQRLMSTDRFNICFPQREVNFALIHGWSLRAAWGQGSFGLSINSPLAGLQEGWPIAGCPVMADAGKFERMLRFVFRRDSLEDLSIGDFLNTVMKWERRATPEGRTSILMGLENMQLFMATQLDPVFANCLGVLTRDLRSSPRIMDACHDYFWVVHI